MILTMNRHAATALMLAACPLSASADQPQKQTPDQRPNIVVIVTDDHSYQTLGTCEKDSPMPYPNFRKLADEGMVFDRSYCANSLCGPSRACIYTGRHSHMNGYLFNEHAAPFDGSQPTFPKMLQKAGYQTAIVGKWHLEAIPPGAKGDTSKYESDPTGFDYWEIFPGQGNYFNPDFITPGKDGKRVVKTEPGYATELVTQKSLKWLDQRDKNKPFMLVVGHKAPHRCWCPSIQNLGRAKQYADAIDPPANLEDDFADRPEFLKMTEQTLLNHCIPSMTGKCRNGCAWTRSRRKPGTTITRPAPYSLSKILKTEKSKRSVTFCCAAGAIIWKTIWAPFFPWMKASARSWII